MLEPSIEWLTGAVTGAPPISTLAVRTRQGVEGVWQPAALKIAGVRHQIVVGAGWKTSSPLNRVTIPSDINLATIAGVPSEVTEFNSPLDSQSVIRAVEMHVSDHVRLTEGLSLDLGILGDFSRGGLPAQSKGLGQFAPPQTYAARPDLIAWNSLSPRVGVAWQVPWLRRLVLRGSWFRLQTPMAGRYLDFSNPESLSGNVYQWIDSNHDGRFQVGEEGALLSRFGGAYSSISPTLERPYANEVDIGAEFVLAPQSFVGFQAFRRDDRQRIAALDTGVPASAFTPVTVVDPGPDGIGGTSDDRPITRLRRESGDTRQRPVPPHQPRRSQIVQQGLLCAREHSLARVDGRAVIYSRGDDCTGESWQCGIRERSGGGWNALHGSEHDGEHRRHCGGGGPHFCRPRLCGQDAGELPAARAMERDRSRKRRHLYGRPDI